MRLFYIFLSYDAAKGLRFETPFCFLVIAPAPRVLELIELSAFISEWYCAATFALTKPPRVVGAEGVAAGVEVARAGVAVGEPKPREEPIFFA